MALHYTCDGCGMRMKKHDLRYVATIDVRAAYDEIEVTLADLVRDHREEMLRLIDQMRRKDPKELEEEVYKQMKLDLCPRCQKAFIRDPLRFRPPAEQQQTSQEIDRFLRSLGFGEGPAAGDEDEA